MDNLPKARGANRPVMLFMLRDNHKFGSWPSALLIQAHISLFSRALSWPLLPCVLTHEMHITILVCVLLGSHRPCCDCGKTRVWCLVPQVQGGVLPHSPNSFTRTSTSMLWSSISISPNKDNVPGAAAAAPTAEQLFPPTPGTLVLPPAPALD